MKAIIFGATGSVGIQMVKQALANNHQVTAFVRTSEKLSALRHDQLTIHKGDVLHPDGVKKAVQQQDVVICALGDGGAGKIRGEGTKNIIDAMNNTGVRRLICMSTIGAGDSIGNLNFFWKHIMFGMVIKKVFKDHQAQEQHIFNSGLDYTIVRPGSLTNGPVTKNYKEGFDGNYRKLTLKISRADVADFMVREMQKQQYIQKAVSISN